MTFWDPAKDSLFAVVDGSHVVAVYTQATRAAFAAEDLGLLVKEVPNSSLAEFWFDNSHLCVNHA